ncbi:MAG: DUF721 domain-containing protein [Bacteroidales bacterium]|jgi:hypothetical protein
MRKKDEMTMQEALQLFIKENNFGDKLTRINVIKAWETVAGDAINKNTKDVDFKNKEIILKINSPALRQNILYSKTEFITKVNQLLGSTVVSNIKVV